MKISRLGKLGEKLLKYKMVSGSVFIFLVAVCLIAIVIIEEINHQKQEELRLLEQTAHRLVKAILDQGTAQRGYLLTEDADFLKSFHAGAKDFTNMSEVLINRNDDQELNSNINETVQKGYYWHQIYGVKQIEMKRKGETAEEEYLKKAKLAFDDFRHSADLLTAKIEKKQRSIAHINKVRMYITLLILFVLSASVIILNIFINVRFLQSVLKPILALNNSVRAYANQDFSEGPPSYHREDELAELFGNVDIMRLEMARRMDFLKLLADIDGLTGLYNRRYLDKVLEEWEQGGEGSGNLSLILFDIDYFKIFNDTYGHLAGDDCLRAVSLELNKLMGGIKAVAARYGGEEFAVVLFASTDKEALLLAERIRKGMNDLQIVHSGSPHHFVTVSVGVAASMPKEGASNDLISFADKALYQSKLNGRNQVSVYKKG